jgi:hypothetical protein
MACRPLLFVLTAGCSVLAAILKEEGLLRDTVWLRDRLRIAAQRRYHRLYRNCVKRITDKGASEQFGCSMVIC